MTYRRRYFAPPELPGVLDLLLLDDSNPRSLLFQVNVLGEHIVALVVGTKTDSAQVDQDRIQCFTDALRSLLQEHLGSGAKPESLLQLLKDWSLELGSLSDQVTNRYFSHSNTI
jgi:uncharacterized alpha-E superfamily protein